MSAQQLRRRDREPLIRFCLKLSPMLAVACTLVGAGVLANYAIPDLPLWRAAPVHYTAHPWTAICLVAIGIASFLPFPRRPGRLSMALVCLIVCIVIFRMATIVAGSNAFSVWSPFRDRLASEAAAGHAISMSPQTMGLLLLLCMALGFLHAKRAALAQIFAGLAVALVLVAHIGFFSRFHGFYGEMALPTMLGGLLGALAILTRSAHRAPLSYLLARRAGSRHARRRLAVLICALVLACLLAAWSGPEIAIKAVPPIIAFLIWTIACMLVRDAREEARRPRRTTGSVANDALLRSHLRGSWERGEILLYYQPQVDLATRRIVGVEAVVRWYHPELGLISPADFVPLAEENGLIAPLGLWILQTACAEVQRWRREGILPHIHVSVNVSPIQLRQRGFVAAVAAILQETGLPAEGLILEITENVMVPDGDRSLLALQELHRAGIRIAIDDFGTGYSSLSYLRRFPIDYLKIDRSFVSELPHDSSAAAIARAIVAMGRSLDMQVVAEGIETLEQADFLESIWCSEGQGYLYSHPLPAEAFLRLIAKGLGNLPDRAIRPAQASIVYD